MVLTVIKTKTAKSGVKPDGSITSKPYRISDSGGLYLEVAISGGKLWRLKYRFAGKEKRLALGSYPEVNLKEARARSDHHRKQIAEGIDPSELRKADKLSTGDQNSLEAITREWHV